jgi:7-keto-8-aminopelargonate synthetase-like enzyme
MNTFVKQEQTVMIKTGNWMKRQVICFETVISKNGDCCSLSESQKYMVRSVSYKIVMH